MSYFPNNPNGQATRANSSPVTLASDQTALPITDNSSSLTVDNAGTFPVQAALNAGTNNIGDVDVLTQPARSRTVDALATALQTDALMNGLTALTPKFAIINRATNADGAAVVNLVSAKKIRVLRVTLISAGTVSFKWQSATSNTSGAGSNTDLTGLISLVANTGVSDSFSPVGLFETVSGEGLKLNLNAAVQVSGYLTYIEV